MTFLTNESRLNIYRKMLGILNTEHLTTVSSDSGSH
jgi:hypothetical protein